MLELMNRFDLIFGCLTIGDEKREAQWKKCQARLEVNGLNVIGFHFWT